MNLEISMCESCGKKRMPLDGSDIDLNQVRFLVSCFGAPGQGRKIAKRTILASGLSAAKVEDLVRKGYLEVLSDDDFMIPGSVTGSDIPAMLREQNNDAMVANMNAGMFGFPLRSA